MLASADHLKRLGRNSPVIGFEPSLREMANWSELFHAPANRNMLNGKLTIFVCSRETAP